MESNNLSSGKKLQLSVFIHITYCLFQNVLVCVAYNTTVHECQWSLQLHYALVCLMLLHARSTTHSNIECQPTHTVLVYIMSSILTVVKDQCLMLNTPPMSAREHSWTDWRTDRFRKWFASVCSPQLTFNKVLTNSTTLVTIIISHHLNIWHRVLQGRRVFQLDFWIMSENNLCDTSTSLWYLHIFCSAG